MSKFQELKRELSILDKTFGPRHEHFRVEAHGLDEVTYRFIAPDGEHIVHCNISVSFLYVDVFNHLIFIKLSTEKMITVSVVLISICHCLKGIIS